MPSPFQTEQMTLARLLSGSHVFAFPAFQRPYRWSVDEAMTLLDDIASAALRRDPGYFLGNIVLTQESGRRCFVIDGRQRLTTLFILLCVLRDLETDRERKLGLHRLVRDGGSKTHNEAPGWRLTFPETERPFVEAVIANPNKVKIEVKDHYLIAERLGAMLEVADGYRAHLSAPAGETGMPRLEDFTDYLLNQCEVIVLTAANSTSGLRLFQVLNNRGLQLSEADLIKPDLLHALPQEDQPRAARMWENMEDQLGSEHLDTLLRAYVFIQSGDWIAPGQDFTEALKAIMLSRGAEVFHFEDLPTYGGAFSQIQWGDIDFTDPTRNPNALMLGLYFLGRTMGEWKEFLPVAMEILVRFEEDEDQIFAHLSALDRTFFTWFINETSEYARRNICYRMIMQLRDGEDLLAETGSLRPPARELEKAMDALTQPFARLFQRGALIRRVELALCMKAGKLPPEYLDQTSAEHILPKNPRPGSQWLIDFTRQQHRECLDLLGNGIPLSRDLDKRVGNKDFAMKKAAYERAGADRYFLSVKDICQHENWTPDTIRNRTNAIADLLKSGWATAPVAQITGPDFQNP